MLIRLVSPFAVTTHRNLHLSLKKIVPNGLELGTGRSQHQEFTSQSAVGTAAPGDSAARRPGALHQLRAPRRVVTRRARLQGDNAYFRPASLLEVVEMNRASPAW